MGNSLSSQDAEEASFSTERKDYRAALIVAPTQTKLGNKRPLTEEEKKIMAQKKKNNKSDRIRSIAPGATIVVSAGIDFSQIAKEASMLRKITIDGPGMGAGGRAPAVERKKSFHIALRMKKEMEAATKIQRIYRGYAVRKSLVLYRKRTEVAREILHTEKEYLKFLNVILKLYYYPLKEKAASEFPLLSVEELNMIFPQIEMLKLYNTILLDALDNKICARWNFYQTIGDSILSLIKFLKPPYVYYISHFPQIIHTIKSASKRAPVSSFLRSCKNSPESAGLDLQALVSMPFQRVPRYILLIKEALKYTLKPHTDFFLLHDALSKMEEIANVANDRLREEESTRTIMRISNRLNPPVSNLLLPFRKLIYEGRIMYKIGRGYQIDSGGSSNYDLLPTTPPKHCQMFLFTDFLLLTEESRLSMLFESNPKLRPVLIVNLENAMILDLPQLTEHESSYEFQVHSLDVSVVFCTKTSADKQKWMESITTCINDLTERALTYHPFWRNKEITE